MKIAKETVVIVEFLTAFEEISEGSLRKAIEQKDGSFLILQGDPPSFIRSIPSEDVTVKEWILKVGDHVIVDYLVPGEGRFNRYNEPIRGVWDLSDPAPSRDYQWSMNSPTGRQFLGKEYKVRQISTYGVALVPLKNGPTPSLVSNYYFPIQSLCPASIDNSLYYYKAGKVEKRVANIISSISNYNAPLTLYFLDEDDEKIYTAIDRICFPGAVSSFFSSCAPSVTDAFNYKIQVPLQNKTGLSCDLIRKKIDPLLGYLASYYSLEKKEDDGDYVNFCLFSLDKLKSYEIYLILTMIRAISYSPSYLKVYNYLKRKYKDIHPHFLLLFSLSLTNNSYYGFDSILQGTNQNLFFLKSRDGERVTNTVYQKRISLFSETLNIVAKSHNDDENYPFFRRLLSFVFVPDFTKQSPAQTQSFLESEEGMKEAETIFLSALSEEARELFKI